MDRGGASRVRHRARSEEHTSELQSRSDLVCRLLLEKKKKILKEVCSSGMNAAKLPEWAKMTPNVTHIEDPSRSALSAGCTAVRASQLTLRVICMNL